MATNAGNQITYLYIIAMRPSNCVVKFVKLFGEVMSVVYVIVVCVSREVLLVFFTERVGMLL